MPNFKMKTLGVYNLWGQNVAFSIDFGYGS